MDDSLHRVSPSIKDVVTLVLDILRLGGSGRGEREKGWGRVGRGISHVNELGWRDCMAGSIPKSRCDCGRVTSMEVAVVNGCN